MTVRHFTNGDMEDLLSAEIPEGNSISVAWDNIGGEWVVVIEPESETDG